MQTFRNIPDSGSPSWKEPVADEASLPLENNSAGDVRVTLDSDTIWVWGEDDVWHEISSGGGGLSNAFSVIQPQLGDTLTASGADTVNIDSPSGTIVSSGEDDGGMKTLVLELNGNVTIDGFGTIDTPGDIRLNTDTPDDSRIYFGDTETDYGIKRASGSLQIWGDSTEVNGAIVHGSLPQVRVTGEFNPNWTSTAAGGVQVSGGERTYVALYPDTTNGAGYIGVADSTAAGEHGGQFIVLGGSTNNTGSTLADAYGLWLYGGDIYNSNANSAAYGVNVFGGDIHHASSSADSGWNNLYAGSTVGSGRGGSNWLVAGTSTNGLPGSNVFEGRSTLVNTYLVSTTPYQILNDARVVIASYGSLQASATYTLPQNPDDYQIISLGAATNGVTALTLNAGAGHSIVSPLTTLVAGTTAKYIFVPTGTRWIKIG